MSMNTTLVLIVILALVVLCSIGMQEPSIDEQIDYVANVLESEAGGEGYDGVNAVATVIKNRMVFTNKTAYEIVIDPHQFTKPFAVSNRGSYAWNLAALLEEDPAWINVSTSPCPTATHFYAHKKCNPWWAEHLVDVKVIGNHTFGRLKDGKYSK